MGLEEDLNYQKEQLALVRQQITKLRSTHVLSYGHAGNSANYKNIDDLVKDENRLLKNIARLEAASSGHNTLNNIFVSGIRIR
jgi:hypothetical protein